jgi:hypothetical protein
VFIAYDMTEWSAQPQAANEAQIDVSPRFDIALWQFILSAPTLPVRADRGTEMAVQATLVSLA